MGLLKKKIGYITLSEETFIHDMVWKYGYDDFRIFPEGTVLSIYKTRFSHRLVVDFGKFKPFPGLQRIDLFMIGTFKRYLPLNKVKGEAVMQEKK